MDSDSGFKEVKITTILGIYMLFIILYFAVITIVSIFTTNGFQTDFNSDNVYITVMIMLIFLSIAIISVFRPTKKAVKLLYYDFKSKIKFYEIFKVIGLAICLIIGSKGLIIGISYYFSPSFAATIIKDSSIEINKTSYYIIFTIVSLIISPIMDELTFRSVLFKRISKRTHNIYIGIIISSMIYGIIGDTSEIAGMILLGVVNCILYIKYKNILVPMMVEYIYNIISLIFIDNFIDKSIKLTSDGIGICLGIGAVIFSIGISLFIKFIRNNNIYLKKSELY